MDFIAFLKSRYGNYNKAENLPAIENEAFFGMWHDHHEMEDSSDWVKNIREKEWG